MNACVLATSPDIELLFYGELEAADRARVQAHVARCAACRERLADLAAIRDAMAAGARVDAPPAGDWSGFMRRLDTAIARPPAARTRRPELSFMLAVAATIALVTVGIIIASRVHPAVQPVAQVANATHATASGADAALVRQSEDHFDRAKLVVLGLATRDPGRTTPEDWAYERELAGRMLTDTRLYRMAAQSHGLTQVAGTLSDLETVLLETSLSDPNDPGALARVQRLIRKRDLLTKMQVVAAGTRS